jgi:hypothetical protein
MDEKEIQAAFRGNENASWYRALLQILWEEQHKERINVAAHTAANNALAIAADAGAYSALDAVLNTLANYVEPEG